MIRNIFDNLKEIEKYKNPETIIVTDIDGTISTIQSLPHEAVITRNMEDVLTKIQKKFMLLAIITGRPLSDAFKMIDIPGILYIGNHGMEYQKNNSVVTDKKILKYIPKINKLYEKLKAEPNIKMSGIILENKNACLSIHYRLSENPQIARKNILQTLKNIKIVEELQIKEGKKIIEIRPPVGNDKGVIIKKIVKKYHTKKLIYLGDDITDVDAFKEINNLSNNNNFQGISIVVQSDETPEFVLNNADYYVKSVEDVKKFFNWLLSD
jgi:trehalose 6-phosphate phosphatase